jgi:hypothetical protein
MKNLITNPKGIELLQPWSVTGFADGEASFLVSKYRKEYIYSSTSSK